MVIDQQHITILGEKIPVSYDEKDISELKFLPENPRIYACTHGEPHFEDYPEGKQQEVIYAKLLEEPSVKNLIPEVKRHGGLMEPILIRHDTQQVIEGNSRLAVYRKLAEKEPDKWRLIPCYIISALEARQQAAYLNQVHVKGKTSWTAYEKANFAYVRFEKGMLVDEIAELFGETPLEIDKRVKAIQMMKNNGDNEQSHFSYYNDVFVRNRVVSKEIEENPKLKEVLLREVKTVGPVASDDATAQDVPGSSAENGFPAALELRNKLPTIIQKGGKPLKNYLRGKITFDEAYENAKISDAHQRVRKAREFLDGVEKNDLVQLDQNRRNALWQDFKRLRREIERVGNILADLNKH